MSYEEDTRYKKHCTQDNDTSVPFKVGTLGLHIVLPIANGYSVIFSWIPSLSKVILVLEKARSHSEHNLGCRGAESPGWFDVLPKNSARDMRCDAWVSVLSWGSCQSPVAHSCGRLNHPKGFCGGMFKLNAKFDADSLLYLLSYFECNSHTVHMLTHQCPHWLVQWSCHCSHAHSSPLSLTARWHRCCANSSHDIKNGWTFSWKTSSYMALSMESNTQQIIKKWWECLYVFWNGTLEVLCVQ